MASRPYTAEAISLSGNTSDGHAAEVATARYLVSKGFTILEQNWRRPQCEIDIVALKDKEVFFYEVKYRRTASYGSGLEYITKEKKRRLHFAARMWLTENRFNGQSHVRAIEVEGGQCEVGKEAEIYWDE